jgi:hypothetical protein
VYTCVQFRQLWVVRTVDVVLSGFMYVCMRVVLAVRRHRPRKGAIDLNSIALTPLHRQLELHTISSL